MWHYQKQTNKHTNKPFKSDFQPQQTSEKLLKIPMLRPYSPEICELIGHGYSQASIHMLKYSSGDSNRGPGCKMIFEYHLKEICQKGREDEGSQYYSHLFQYMQPEFPSFC